MKYQITVYHGGEYPTETFKAETLEDARQIAMRGEHSEIINLTTNQLVE